MGRPSPRASPVAGAPSRSTRVGTSGQRRDRLARSGSEDKMTRMPRSLSRICPTSFCRCCGI